MRLQSQRLSKIPGLRHGFTTRLSGRAFGPRATWDFDPRGAQYESHVKLAMLRIVGHPVTFSRTHQVHGSSIVRAPFADLPEADGTLTEETNRLIGVLTADCAPLLFASLRDRRLHQVAAVHAGWRGAVAGIAERAAELLLQTTDREHVYVAIGPTIGAEAFEVGPEVKAAAEQNLGQTAPGFAGRGDRFHLDLRALLRLQLTRAGILAPNIDDVGGCTYTQPALFYSYRRDGADAGRMLSAIAMESGIHD